MAEETEGFEQTDYDDFDLSDLEPYEAEAEEQEARVDETIASLAKNQKKLAAKLAAREQQEQRDKLVGDFYAKASPEARELADVLIAGVSEPEKVKRLLELAEAKAANLTAAKTEEAAEEENVEKAFSPPVPTSPPEVRDEGKETAERTRKGDPQAAWWEFLAAPAKSGPDMA